VALVGICFSRPTRMKVTSLEVSESTKAQKMPASDAMAEPQPKVCRPTDVIQTSSSSMSDDSSRGRTEVHPGRVRECE
jgi:hypothetical protein